MTERRDASAALLRDLRDAGLIADDSASPFDRTVEADLHHLVGTLLAAGWQPPSSPGIAPAQPGPDGPQVDLNPPTWIVRPAGSVDVAECKRLNRSGDLCEDHNWFLEVFYDDVDLEHRGWAVRWARAERSRMGRDGRIDWTPRHSGRPVADFLWPTAAAALAAARDVVENLQSNGWTYTDYREFLRTGRRPGSGAART